MALDDLLPGKLPIKKPTEIGIKPPGELSISKTQSNNIQKAGKDKSPSDFKKYRDQKQKELETAREEAKARREKAKQVAKDRKAGLKADAETVKNNRSEDMKAGGIAKLNAIVDSQVTKITALVIPNLLILAEGLIRSKAGELCPPPEITKQALNTFNNIVKSLNFAVEGVDKIAKISTATSTAANTLQQTSTTLSIALPIASAAAKTVPVIPGFVVSAIDDLDYINNKILYKQDGAPRLPPLVGGVNAITMQISLFSSVLRNASGIISGISSLLSNCLPEGEKNEVEQLSDLTKQYNDYGNDNYENYDNSSYKGFIIKIEEVPYTPTVNRRRAVGYTTNGIPLIQTELSFTTNNQTLTTELKLIIDRDNLKAY
jgi:hypothetical protein